VAPERAARAVGLPAGDVGRHGPRERRGHRLRRGRSCGGTMMMMRRRRRSRRRRRRRVVLRGGEHEEAVPQARGADAAAGLEGVPLAPHAHLISSQPPSVLHGRGRDEEEEEESRRKNRQLNSSGRRARTHLPPSFWDLFKFGLVSWGKEGPRWWCRWDLPSVGEAAAAAGLK
jgi:hypothetical protein